MRNQTPVSVPSHTTRLWRTKNWFRYEYPAPVTRATTRLRLLPRHPHAGQQIVTSNLLFDPWPRAARSWVDAFGNQIVEIEHAELKSHLEIQVEACVSVIETRADEPFDPATFLTRTRLVDQSEELLATADRLRGACRTDEALAWECMEYVYREMRYTPGATHIGTTASTAFAHRAGVCQDFAQVMLAILRAAGLPARYVSGHAEGEGHMHAWTEVFYAADASAASAWHAFDPTHNRAAGDGYVTIAVGRDYDDVSPISGCCYGPAPGALKARQETRRG